MSFLRLFRGWMVILGLIGLLLLVNVSQTLSLLILPLNRRWFMLVNMEIKRQFCVAVARGARLCGNTMELSGDVPRAENTLLFANHQSMIDIILIWMWAVPVHTAGWIKWFAKDSLKYIPALGWGMMFINTLFVKRDWAKDAESIRSTFARIRDGRLPTWLVIFPEGTRMKPSKLASSQAHARRKSLEVFDHVLVPRGRGIHASLVGLDGHIVSVYDITIQYVGAIPSLTRFFTVGGHKVRFHAKRYEISEVPMRHRDLNQWLFDLFSEKNRKLAITVDTPNAN
jgi:1-acyl-sn-glycerol-3-phosphate acyltransferase